MRESTAAQRLRLALVQPDGKAAMKTRIAIVDDHAILRAGLRRLVEEKPDFSVVAEMSSAAELLEALPRLNVDVLLLDITMPGQSGLDILTDMRTDYPHIKIVILTMHSSREFFKQALRHGVEGYLLKDDLYENLLDALMEILAGKTYYSKKVTDSLAAGYSSDLTFANKLDALTSREKEILQLVVEGNKNKEISSRLDISQRTVETHRSKIMQKLDVKSMAELVQQYTLAQG